MRVEQLNAFPCPACQQPLAIPHTITIGSLDRRTGSVEVKVDIDREKAREVFEAHCLVTPGHQVGASDDASPDTSQEYFLDLLRRIDDVTDTGHKEAS